MPVQHRDFIATDIINPRLESFRDKFRLHEIHPARAKTVSFRATVLLFAVSVPFQPRPARFERNEESDGPLGRRRGRRRPRKLVVSIRVWDAARTLDSRSFVLFFVDVTDRRGIVGSPPKETILTTVNVAMIRLSGILEFPSKFLMRDKRMRVFEKVFELVDDLFSYFWLYYL